MLKRVLFSAAGLVVLALGAIGSWVWWPQSPAPYAWVCEQPEQVVSGVQEEEHLRVPFLLQNRANRPLRVLGSNAC